jgi:replicative DNA helicase
MVPFHSDFQSDCLILNEFWIKRTLHRFGHYLNQKSMTADALELLGTCSETTDIIYRHIHQMTEITLKDGVQELAKELKDISLSSNGMLGLSSSIRGINEVVKGYRRGNLIILAGSTGEGKTTLECQEIRHLIEQDIPVGCFTLEMKTLEIILMMACDAVGVSSEDILSADIDAINRVSAYMERVKTMPLMISDKPAIKIGELKSVARMWKKNRDIKIIFIDLIHLMQGDVQYLSAEQKFNDIANELKALAKELDIPIVALAHLHRKQKGDKTAHEISDLKYASGIEQAADVVLLIYRPELYDIETDKDGASTKGFAKIIIGKLRLLPKRDVKCHFSGTRFTDLNEYQYKQLEQPKPKEQETHNPYRGIKDNRTLEQIKQDILSDKPF